MKTCRLKFLVTGILFLSFGTMVGAVSPSFAATAEPLTLEKYLEQVRKGNDGVKGALKASEAGRERAQEGELILSPTVFANFQYQSDAKLPPFSLIQFDKMNTTTFTLGINQITSFGLQAKLHYDLMSANYQGLTGNFANFIPSSYANASPILELTQSLWSNGFGRSTRATVEIQEAQALASSYASSFQTKTTLSQAEITYWRLALARQAVSVQTEALDRAKKIYNWNAEKVRLHLKDEGDVIQAEALVQSRELDLLSTRNEERAASRSFNSQRNIDSDHVDDTLVQLEPQSLEGIQIPKRAVLRDDVKAAQQSARVSAANAQISIEKNNPTLDIYATLALNGQSGYTAFQNLSDTFGPSFSLNRPTQTIGIRFTAPLEFGTASKSREGWRLERTAAELNYDRKVFEQEQSWLDLNENFEIAKKQFALAQKLELTQKSKLDHERDRLQKGRSTTFQVLLFEQDYLLAQLGRIKNQANILNIIAQMKVYGE